MRKRRLIWQLYPPFLILGVAALVAVSIYLSSSFRKFYIEKTAEDLSVRAKLLENRILPILESDINIDSLCVAIGKDTATRITVILPSGVVIADSEEDPAKMNNHADRPEIISALNRETGESIRHSYTLNEDMMYIAIPLLRENKIVAVLRVSIPLLSISESLGPIYFRIAMGAILAAIFLALVSYLIARRIKRPIDVLRKGAERFAQGDFDHKLYLFDYHEIGALSESMNQMAAQLDERIKTIVRQRDEIDAILTGMIEGVLAVDLDEKVLIMNNAALRMFEVEGLDFHNRSIEEAVRNAQVHDFVGEILSQSRDIESEITIGPRNEMTLRAVGTVLKSEKGEKIGALAVFHDITELRRLENMRREFVANVSHELKTPITAIKGYVETLRDGAIANPDEAKNFLQIVASHTDRLNAIIDDLLSLSKIEQDADRNEIELESVSIDEIVLSAIKSLNAKAEQKKISIRYTPDPTINESLNSNLIQQALCNLIDNAINYSESSNDVLINVDRNESELTIAVTDHGCGIEKRHLPRLFERFYRADTARSRKLGGTGLGLAIVKHIAIAHGGHVTVNSEPGKGSQFAIHIPRRPII